MMYPGVREQVDYWLHAVEKAAQADGERYGLVLELQTGRMFDNEPAVLLLATLADKDTPVEPFRLDTGNMQGRGEE